MPDFTKLAAYLDSFNKDEPNYDLACFIKNKIAKDLQDTRTINNGEEEDLEDNDITMSTPDQQASNNTEGQLMSGAFQELDVLNELDKEKDKVVIPGQKDNNGNAKLNASTESVFGDNVGNRKEASLFELLQKKIKR